MNDKPAEKPKSPGADLTLEQIGDLEAYDALEPKRFVSYNNAMSSGSSVVVATASVRFDPPNR